MALCLLVSVGMGEIAQDLGLTDTAGAFAAGVLLANTNYRAQIQADIFPFKGILLGIFFMDAGSSFDIDLAISEWPTILTGAVALVVLKFTTLLAATRVPRWLEPNRLPFPDGIRLAALLSSGGEFAFVVLALAEKLKALPAELGGVLTAIVLITMAVTPLLGDLAGTLADGLDGGGSGVQGQGEGQGGKAALDVEVSADGACEVAENAIVVCGWGEVGRSVSATVDAMLAEESESENETGGGFGGPPQSVAFTTRLSALDTHVGACDLRGIGTALLFGDGANPSVLRASGVTSPRAVFVTYSEQERCISACVRLRASFPETPIYSRAQTRDEAQELQVAGATEVW